jgi:hypothetical protein
MSEEPSAWRDLYDMVPGPALADALAHIDPTALHGHQLVEVVVAHQKQIAYAQAGFLRAVREMAWAVPGVVSGPPQRRPGRMEDSGSELAFALACTEYAAEQSLAAAALAIDVAPDLIAALELGELDLPKLDMLTRELAEVDDDACVRSMVAALRPDFACCTVPQLRNKLRVLLLKLDPEAVRERHKKTVEKRFVEHSEFANGTALLSGCYLPKDKAAAAWAHVDAIAQATRSAGDPLQREIDQIRADVFADLLAGVDPSQAGAVTPAPRRGVINLHIGLTTLACLNDHPAEIPGFGPVLADIAREAAAQMARTAQWRFTVTGHDGEAVAEGRLRYRPTLQQRAFVAARDQTCRAPGCPRPAMRCDIDHVRAWADGGPTTIENLMLLCRGHHRMKHEHGFRAIRTYHGVEWTTPFGRRYTVISLDERLPNERAVAFDHYARSLHGRVRLRR